MKAKKWIVIYQKHYGEGRTEIELIFADAKQASQIEELIEEMEAAGLIQNADIYCLGIASAECALP